MRTSSTHPLKIAEIGYAEGCGKVGFTFGPGETRADEPSPAAQPDRRLDHALVESWDAAALVRLIEPAERDEPHIPRLGNALFDGELVYHYLPIREDGMPDPVFHDICRPRARSCARCCAPASMCSSTARPARAGPA